MKEKEHDFTVTIFDTSERADMWMRIFGSLTVPVESFIPDWVTLPGFIFPQKVYFLKMDALTSAEREQLVIEVMERFDLDRSEVSVERMPILAEECTLTINNPHKWLD